VALPILPQGGRDERARLELSDDCLCGTWRQNFDMFGRELLVAQERISGWRLAGGTFCVICNESPAWWFCRRRPVIGGRMGWTILEWPAPVGAVRLVFGVVNDWCSCMVPITDKQRPWAFCG